ncbi:Cc8l18.2-like protein [Plakobranchus ocellatus]|uniref:Cc8l18.2-like protein n=1 Tax=Plakobranchus ocellatus TaxID=259542 RepID=A0AAV3YFV2_9GAST|nr:Cc8l18.2-like protein [Plakobranchus ocellatus]
MCKSVSEGWAVATLDFAENYLCEKQDQPQSSYYGYKQVTVHPCIVYYECSCGERTTDNVAIVADELEYTSRLVSRILKEFVLHIQRRVTILKK